MVKSKFKFKHIFHLLFPPLFIFMGCTMALIPILFILPDIVDIIKNPDFVFLVYPLIFLIGGLFLIISSIDDLKKLFVRIKVDSCKISFYTLSSFFHPTVYYLHDFKEYYLTEESIHLLGSKGHPYTFKVAWLGHNNTLKVKIPDFYRNFNEILAATNLKYSRQIEPKEYKPDTVVSFCDEVFATRCKSMERASLTEHKIVMKKIDAPKEKDIPKEKETPKEASPKTYNWKFNQNNDTI